MIWFVLGIAVGFMISIIFTRCRELKKRAGTIRVDISDGTPYLFLELDKGGLEKLNLYKSVILDVNLKNYISH